MRSTIGFAIAALVLGLFGFAFLRVARLDGHMADAGQRLSTLEYEAAQESLTEAEQYANQARFVPWIGSDSRQEIRARQAAVQYWQRKYDTVLPAGAEPVAAVDEENVELQLVVANSAFRVHQTQFKDKAATVKALEETAAGYLTVLKNNTWHPDAAFNYEYIIRLRDAAAKGSQPPPPPKENEEQSDNGDAGAPTPATSQEGFQIYIPLEQGEKNPTGGEAGKASARERKG
jgi:hypothetical protein